MSKNQKSLPFPTANQKAIQIFASNFIYWRFFDLLDYRNFKSNCFNLRPEGYRKATFVTFWEGESLFNYKYFSGKGRVSMFWTSDGYIVKVFFELGKIKYETYNADKYYNGLGLSIRLIKH